MRPQSFAALTLGLAVGALGLLVTARPDPPANPAPTVMEAHQRITAAGEGLIRITPDAAWVVFGSSSHGAFAEQAKALHAERLKEIRARLTAAGVDQADIEPPRLTLTTDKIWVGAVQSERYTMFSELQLVVRDLRQLDAVLSAALDGGADEVLQITYTVSEPEPFRQAAVRAAVEHARQRAEAVAAAAGVRLGRLISTDVQVTDSAGDPHLMTPNAARPAELWVRATVTAVYEE